MSIATAIPTEANKGQREAPQYNAVTWAFTQAATRLTKRGEPVAATLALVAIAHHAECALWSGDGYTGLSRAGLAVLMSVSESTAGKYLRLLGQYGLVEPHPVHSHLYRVPEAAIGGTWRQ